MECKNNFFLNENKKNCLKIEIKDNCLFYSNYKCKKCKFDFFINNNYFFQKKIISDDNFFFSEILQKGNPKIKNIEKCQKNQF